MVTDHCRFEITPLIKFISMVDMNLHAFFVLVHLGHFNIVEVIVLFWLFFFIAQGFRCSTLSTKLFGGCDSTFGRAAILNFGHTEQAQ